MQARDLQDQAARFVQAHGLEASPGVRLLDLVSEVGEVAREVLRSADYGRVPFRPGEGVGRGTRGRPLRAGLPGEHDRR